MMLKNKSAAIFLSFIGLYLIGFQSSSFGQAMCHIDKYRLNKIKGVVVSNGPKGFEPIEDAKVELWKYGKKGNVLVSSGKTDKNGLFAIENIKKGEYVFLVNKEDIGFREFRTEIKKVNQSSDEKKLWVRLGVTTGSEGCGNSKLIDS